jgi:DNA-binding CsgD family transcriptional regulator
MDGSTDRLLGRSVELRALERLLSAVRSGHSGVLVVRGEPGIGKSALIEGLVRSASEFLTLRAVGVESEMELPFAGLHQLCSPLLDRLPLLPGPQRDALATVFGLREGTAPDRFLVGLATLTLLCDAAEQGPLLCVVDDAQWLDQASAQTLSFAARRLLADPVGLVFATRQPEGELSGLPELVVGPLGAVDARALLGSPPGAPTDEQVRDRIVAEAHGNPLALLEWHAALTPAELAGPFALPAGGPMALRLEQSFSRRLIQLPPATQRFLLVAAAEPVGDAVVIWSAAHHLGVDAEAAEAAVDAGLVEVGATVRFRHPLVRSAVYQAAPLAERQRAHEALADVTDADADPDRRAWHRALAAAGPDEDVAEELERAANRAQARGGLAAAAAFLERATALTPALAPRARRALAAAQAKVHTGAFADAIDLLAMADAGPLEERERARTDVVRAQLAFATRRGNDASLLLLKAARRLEPIDVALARATYRDALVAATVAGRLADPGADLLAVARAAADAPPPTHPPNASDLLVEGLAASATQGHAVGLPIIRTALSASRADMVTDEELGWLPLAWGSAIEVWSDERSDALSDRHVQLAREVGALSELPLALNERAHALLFTGDLATATSLVEEVQAAIDAMGITFSPYGAMSLAAWRGDEAEASAMIQATLRDVPRRGEGLGILAAEWAGAVLNNGLGRYQEALAAAQRATGADQWELGLTNWARSELVEAAARCGELKAADDALDRLVTAATASGTDWGLGVAARARALLAEGDEAEPLYREAVERLGTTLIRTELARTHLVYGEWLRREQRRVDAREQLRTAHEMLSSFGLMGFAERARRELVATGETVRRRTVETFNELTAQEACIAKLAVSGLTNPEIGAQLFLSARTVEWHLRKVFTKLGAGSRRELRELLPDLDGR